MLPGDFFSKLKRGPAVILPKDASAIIGRSGLSPGDRVAECGAGSGWLTVQLANAVGPTGKIYSFEKREEFLLFAQKNVKRAGFADRVQFRLADLLQQGLTGEIVDEHAKPIASGAPLVDVDLVVLDLAESDKALVHAWAALKPGGVCVGYLPVVEQAKAFVLTGHALGFNVDRIVRSMHEEWVVRPFGVRPEHSQLVYTALLVFLRKPVPGQAQRPLLDEKSRRKQASRNKDGAGTEQPETTAPGTDAEVQPSVESVV